MQTIASAYPLTDTVLAQRLELAEANAGAAYVDARRRLEPEVGATHERISGVVALFDGRDSPLTQTFGLGLFDPLEPGDWDALELFFRSRDVDVCHEVSPLTGHDTLSQLGARGYRPIEVSTVLVQPIAALPAADPRFRVRQVAEDEAALWSRIAVEGWSTESPDLADFLAAFGRIVAEAEGVHCFLAELDGRPVAAGSLSLRGDVALLAGASTIPSARRQGAQLALLSARLRFAAGHGADLAMMVAQPGSASQRNAERRGFRTAYTRTKWRLAITS